MANNMLSEFYSFRKFIVIQLYMVGLYPIENPNLLYRSLPYLHLVMHMSVAIGLIVTVPLRLESLTALAQAMAVVVGALKIVSFCVYKDDIKSLFDVLNKYYESQMNNPRLPKLLKGVTLLQRLSWTIFLSAAICATLKFISPMLEMLNDKAQGVHRAQYPPPGGVAMISGRMPGIKIVYIFEYIYLGLSGLGLTALSGSVEPLFSLFTLNIISVLRELSYRIVNPDKLSDYDEIIRDTLNQYEVILKTRDMIEKIFGPLILQMFISNALALCFCVFQLSSSSISGLHFISIIIMLTYVVAKFTQTCLCSIAGGRLITASDAYRDAVYDSKWIGTKRHMEFVVITLIQNPIKLVACHFTIISLNIFASVINTTVSYYFLLETLQSD